MKKLTYLVAVFALFLTGCASTSMKVAEKQTISKPAATESQVVFMRSAFLGQAIAGSLYEVKGDDLVFIGLINNNTKIAYNTTPGKHTFMVIGEAADFLEADLTAGKTYHALVTPRMGAWSARFSLWPMSKRADAEHKLNSEEFDKVFAKAKLVEMNPESEAWYAKAKADVVKKKDKYLPVWNQKSAADLAKRTLQPGDGL